MNHISIAQIKTAYYTEEYIIGQANNLDFTFQIFVIFKCKTRCLPSESAHG